MMEPVLQGNGALWVVVGAIAVLFLCMAVMLIRRATAIAGARRVATAVGEGSDGEDSPIDVTELANASWPLVRSLGAKIDAVRAGHDADRTYEGFRHECEVEAWQRASRYRGVWILVWMMPVVGLIGAALAGGEAVSGLATLLAVEVEDLAAIRGQLPAVSAALALAFDMAVVGLGAGLVSMVVVSLVQRQDESALDEVQQAALALLGAGRRVEGRSRPDAPEHTVARHAPVVPMLRRSQSEGAGAESGGRESFWRAPWTAGGGAMAAVALETEEDTEATEGDGQQSGSAEQGVGVTARASRNRFAIMWGFGLLFLGTAAAVVAGWFLDRVLIAPDFALVAIIIGAVFWCMAVLSEEP